MSTLHENNKNPFILPQGPFGYFATIADAIAGVKFKDPGVTVYITSEDKFYYWKNDSEGFVPEGAGGGGSGPTASDVIEATASRNSISATNIYLSDGDGVPMNLAPLVLPFNATLSYMSLSCNTAGSWVAEVHVNGVLVPGATLAIVGGTKTESAYSIDFNIGDAVELYMNGTAIDRPRINAIFRKR